MIYKMIYKVTKMNMKTFFIEDVVDPEDCFSTLYKACTGGDIEVSKYMYMTTIPNENASHDNHGQWYYQLKINKIIMDGAQFSMLSKITVLMSYNF